MVFPPVGKREEISQTSDDPAEILSMFMTTEKLLRTLIMYGMVLLVMTGCAAWQKSLPFKSSSRQQHVDPKAQKRHYDQGLQQYSKDNYGEAKKAFQQVVDLGPGTPLGLKAQENLKKIDKILKTLEEIE